MSDSFLEFNQTLANILFHEAPRRPPQPWDHLRDEFPPLPPFNPDDDSGDDDGDEIYWDSDDESDEEEHEDNHNNPRVVVPDSNASNGGPPPVGRFQTPDGRYEFILVPMRMIAINSTTEEPTTDDEMPNLGEDKGSSDDDEMPELEKSNAESDNETDDDEGSESENEDVPELEKAEEEE